MFGCQVVGHDYFICVSSLDVSEAEVFNDCESFVCVKAWTYLVCACLSSPDRLRYWIFHAFTSVLKLTYRSGFVCLN